MSTPTLDCQHPPVSLPVCIAREEIARRSLRAQQREAKREWPHDEAKRQSHCASALAALQRAWASTEVARAAEEGSPQEPGAAAAGQASGPEPRSPQCEDWIPDYPPQEGDDQPEDDNQDSTEYPEFPEDEQRG